MAPPLSLSYDIYRFPILFKPVSGASAEAGCRLSVPPNSGKAEEPPHAHEDPPARGQRRPARGAGRARHRRPCRGAPARELPDGQLRAADDRHRQPRLPAVVCGRHAHLEVEDQRPVDRQGLRVGRRVRDRREARLLEEQGQVGLRAVQQGVRARPEVVRLRHQPDLLHAGPREGRLVQRLLLRREPGDRRQQGHEDRLRPEREGPAALPPRRRARNDELPVHQGPDQAVADAGRLQLERRRGARAEEQADRRPRRRPADGVLRHRGAGAEREDPRPVRERRRHDDRPLRSRVAEGQPAHRLREQRDRVAPQERDSEEAPAAVAGEGDRRADLEVDRRSRLVSSLRSGGDGRRSVAIALASTIVFFVAAGVAITHAPGWPQVRSSFFDWHEFRSTFPEVAHAFLLNIKIFCIAEAFILAFALFLAVLRSLPGPVFFPLRALAIVYADLFRGVPTILVIAMLGFGAPALGLSYIPKSVTFWGIVSLVLIYSAYVSEVYRAGIDSIHPSQEAAARSLGLSRGQTLRHVVLPQAVRRVIPPLLNDFIGLQKDTALVGTLGAIEAFQQSQIDANATFNFTAYLSAAVLFVAVTIPLARFTDWLVLRDRRRRQAGGATA